MSSGEVIFTSAHQNMGLARFCLTIADVLKDINQLTESIIGAESLEICFNIIKSTYGERVPLVPLGCYIYIALQFMVGFQA